MFTQNQIAEFKEAFQFIDSDKDGLVSKNDLRATFDALGKCVCVCVSSPIKKNLNEHQKTFGPFKI